ncbi:FimD/PapC C-terminal domain-containing protein, partial [Shigella flexneri]|uniref:FimD/PapC C-terminal domain-containing protein n=1 Tax=Shigella flexneri TaxID=623 RepID=UPI003CF09287
DGNGSHASTLKSPSYTKSVSWQHYPSLADSGIVGDRGELYLSGLPEKGQVTLSWGENASTKCIFNYSLSTPESESGLIEQGVTCH